jgi:hypothetical protein
LCAGLIPLGQQLWGCSVCCFDLCYRCSEQTEARQADEQVGDEQEKAAATECGEMAGKVRKLSFNKPLYLVGSWDRWTTPTRLAPVEGGVYGASIRLPGAPVPQAVWFQLMVDRGGENLGPLEGSEGVEQEIWLPAKTMEIHFVRDLRNRTVSWKLVGLFDELAAIPRGLAALSENQFSLMGSWDNWTELTPFMPAGDHALQAHVAVHAAQGVEEFLVVQKPEVSEETRFFCLSENRRDVLGPLSQPSRNWRVEVPRGCQWLRLLWCPWGDRRRIAWSFLGPSGEKVEANRGILRAEASRSH